MDINLPYGKTFIQIDSNIGEILYPKNISKIRILEESIISSLEIPTSSPPLSKLIKKSHKISLIIPDKTRAFPAKIILPVVLKYIEKNGKDQYIDIIIANGLHKPMSKDEIIELIGKNIYYIYNTINHISDNDEDQVNLNKRTSYGTPLIFNRNVYESDLKIGLGVIEPHFFAGYSGGGKSILPGVAGIEAIFKNHSYKMIGDKYSKYGLLERNIIRRDIDEFQALAGLDFIINITLNKEKNITGVFSGNPIDAHRMGVKFLDRYVKIQFKEQADIVITTNGGYPLDRNIYQTVKGMATGEIVVKNGGVIIIVSECRDGLGGHRDFYNLFKENSSPEKVLDYIKRNEPIRDQWQAQILARILLKANIFIVSDMDKNILYDLNLVPFENIEDALDEAYNVVGKKSPRIIIIPEGPYTIPYLKP